MGKYEIVRFDSNGINLDVRVSPNEDTVWLSQAEIAILFDVDRSRVSRHISRIYTDGELDKKSTYAESAQVQVEGGRKISRNIPIYNLDVIIAVGYRINGRRGTLFRKWASSVLKEYLIKGYSINEQRVLVTDDNYVHLVHKVDSIDDRLSKIEKESSRANPSERIFFEGEFYDAVSFLEDIIRKADKSIVLVDPYCDKKALDILRSRKADVAVEIFRSPKARLSQNEIDAFNMQYGGLSCNTRDSFHDRFLILDGVLAYHIGASLNYAGKKAFEVSRINDGSVVDGIMKELGK
jgi:hypothetical protein